jgi:hypothetical protein
MSGVVVYLEDWFIKMADVIKTRANVCVTDVYLSCLRDNLYTLKEIKKQLDEDSTLKFDPHVLCSNRVEGL